MKESSNTDKIIAIKILIKDGEFNPFHLYYEVEKSLVQSESPKPLGSKEERVCRFCLKNQKETSFKKIAHVMPEFMGNKSFFSYFECDTCNQLFSKYETSLSSYGGILNTFSKIKGKKGYSKHKGNIEDTEAFVSDDKVVFRIKKPNRSKDSIKSLKYDENTGLMTFNTTKTSHIPSDAYKALLKIALSLLSENDILNYEKARKWLINEEALDFETNKLFLNVFQKIGGNRFPHPWVILMKRRKQFEAESIPEHTVLLFYGLFGFQFFIPTNTKDLKLFQGDEIKLPVNEYISFFRIKDNKEELGVRMVNFSSTEKSKNPSDKFSVAFKPSKGQ